MNDPRRSFPVLLAVTALALSGASLQSQTLSNTAAADPANPPMKQFVMIFRQSNQQLTETDKQRRDEETRAWARQQNAAGHKLDPHILAPESHWIGPAPAHSAGPVTALLFFEARDFAQAVEVAQAHPAVRYGASVEVRPWAPPPAPPPAVQP